MLIFYLVTIFFAIGFFLQAWTLGIYISKKSDMFESHPLIRFALGGTIWFTFTVFALFPFIWLNLNTLYYVIIFLIKESLTFTFLVARREEIWPVMKKEWKMVLPVFFAGILITIINRFGLTLFMDNNNVKVMGSFQIWKNLIEGLELVTSESRDNVLNWPLALISSMLGYSLITGWIVMFSKYTSFFEYLTGFMAFIGGFILLSDGKNLSTMFGVWNTLFAFYLCTQVLINSRRRYAVFFASCLFGSWAIDHDVIITYSALAISTTLVYTYMKKSKVYLFWVQLVSPLGIVSSLYIFEFSIIGAIFVIALSIFAYSFMLTYVKQESHIKLNKLFMKTRIWLPITIVLGIVIWGSTLFITGSSNFVQSFIYKKGVVDWLNYNFLYIIQMIGVFFILIFIGYTVYKWEKERQNTNGIKMFIILSFAIVLLAYNPFSLAIIGNSNLKDGFYLLRSVAIMPLGIGFIIWLKSITWTPWYKRKLLK